MHQCLWTDTIVVVFVVHHCPICSALANLPEVEVLNRTLTSLKCLPAWNMIGCDTNERIATGGTLVFDILQIHIWKCPLPWGLVIGGCLPPPLFMPPHFSQQFSQPHLIMGLSASLLYFKKQSTIAHQIVWICSQAIDAEKGMRLF